MRIDPIIDKLMADAKDKFYPGGYKQYRIDTKTKGDFYWKLFIFNEISHLVLGFIFFILFCSNILGVIAFAIAREWLEKHGNFWKRLIDVIFFSIPGLGIMGIILLCVL